MTTSKMANVYWDADGYYYADAATLDAGEGPHADLDSAITTAQADGFKIGSVSMTRGHIKSRGTKASREPMRRKP